MNNSKGSLGHERAPPRPARRIMLVDDHPIVLDGLRSLLQQESDLVVCAEAPSVPLAKARLREHRPDALVVDLTLQDGDGLELVRDARRRYPDLAILVLSMQDERVYAPRLIAAGANGYLMKNEAVGEFVRALRQVLDGGLYLSSAASAQILDEMLSASPEKAGTVDQLTDRELQVLNLIGRGMSTRQVSETLNLSIKTVESYRQKIKRKLHLRNSAQLVQYAINWQAGRHQPPGAVAGSRAHSA